MSLTLEGRAEALDWKATENNDNVASDSKRLKPLNFENFLIFNFYQFFNKNHF